MNTDLSTRAMLPPIDRLRKLAGWRHVAEVPAGRLWKRDGFIFETEPVFSEIEIEPTFPELRADLAAKLEADARPDCSTQGSVHGQVEFVLLALPVRVEITTDRQGLHLVCMESDGGMQAFRSQHKRVALLAALEHAHAKGLL